MLGTQVNALVIAFLHRETLALTKASSFPINSSTKASSFPINSSIFQNVSNARGLPWGTLMPSPRATIKFVTAPPLDWQREQMILGCPGGGAWAPLEMIDALDQWTWFSVVPWYMYCTLANTTLLVMAKAVKHTFSMIEHFENTLESLKMRYIDALWYFFHSWELKHNFKWIIC